MGPSTERVTTSWVPCTVAAGSRIRGKSKGQSCINPSIRTFLQSVLSLTGIHGIAMNFSAGKAGRKWPCAAFDRSAAATLTIAAVVLLLSARGGPAEAARRGAAWSQAPWSDLFGAGKPRPRRAALPSVPLPKARPAEAPGAEASKPEPGKPAAESQPPADTEKPVEQAAPAPPQPSACRLALTETVAIAPSIPDIKGVGGCGGEDLVRLEAVVLPDNKRGSGKPPASPRGAMGSQ